MITEFLHHKLLNITPSAGLALLACMPAAIQAADVRWHCTDIHRKAWRLPLHTEQDRGMESTPMMNPAQ